MPRGATSSSSQSRPALRRNQACRSCRRRKLKCDAARPHCGTCVKQHEASISVPAPLGFSHPAQPQCFYDPVEGLTMEPATDPTTKITRLEQQVFALKKKLREKNASSALPSLDPTPNYGYNGPLPESVLREILPPLPGQLDSPFRGDSSSPEPGMIKDPLVELIISGWNPDLPDPPTLNHYIDVFFRCDPCGSRVLHRPSFLASMRLSPRDPGFPHASILHAICASASRWSPQQIIILPDGTRRDVLGEFHSTRTRHYIDKCMSTGEHIFSVMQACIILSWYFYQEGRWVEVWIFAAFQIRVSVPLRLNYPGTFSNQDADSPGAYLAPPKGFQDLESRRRTWWMSILFDRIASVGGWLHSIDERDLGTEFPLRNEDFEAETLMPSNPQDMATPDVFIRHPAQYTDSFILFIKAVMLFGKVTDFNVRGNLRAPTAPSKHQNPFFLPGFDNLDKLVANDFLENLPHIFKNNNGVTVTDSSAVGQLDTDLYMVHIIPHAATITLHNPYINFNDPNNVSSARCIHATRSILAAYHSLTATSLDITRLHPLVTICWYLAAAVQVQLCKYFIEIKDSDREASVWGEINVLRQVLFSEYAMLAYGEKSPIGTSFNAKQAIILSARQERLLQILMEEIIKITSHKQPLEVGTPLYPFSSSSLWRKGNNQPSADGIAGLPLPLDPLSDKNNSSSSDPFAAPTYRYATVQEFEDMLGPLHQRSY
ncbi:hypothetical protein DFJ43DRAFT_1135853 [Lentinula guzmanii]|uniref:Zn(2)-C6 fungal-type domain-containing protein n=1 Tax=Lentinula guzmanii TaxID=2804957 RepID=A0AA38N4P2_9AGAR|nr:hypothetical protein DFJ43DRAFT_1135853 [Lentinula guzmanii]